VTDSVADPGTVTRLESAVAMVIVLSPSMASYTRLDERAGSRYKDCTMFRRQQRQQP